MFDYDLFEINELHAQIEQKAPAVFRDSEGPFFLDWIALGSDGSLYIAPAEPGGWLQRKKYQGPMDQLVQVSPTKARTIAWYLYGDLGQVTIAGEVGD
jgi:hypothetical protein